MAAKLTRLTHKIAIKLHLVQRAVPFAILAPGGQSGNFWIHPRTKVQPTHNPLTESIHRDIINIYF